jgi:hypothetical protein
LVARETLSIALSEQPAMLVFPELVRAQQVSYLLVTDCLLQYPSGRSRIAYIGTTYTGYWRLASSTAERARRILRQHGVSSFEVIPVRARPKRGIRTWELLERSLLSVFRERYGTLPRCNKRGGSFSKEFCMTELILLLKQFE